VRRCSGGLMLSLDNGEKVRVAFERRQHNCPNGSMPTILTTRTARWVMCLQSCSGKNEWWIKPGEGTGLWGQDQCRTWQHIGPRTRAV